MCSDFGTEYDYSSGYPSATVIASPSEFGKALLADDNADDGLSPSELAGKMDQDLKTAESEKDRYIKQLEEALDLDLQLFDRYEDELLKFKVAELVRNDLKNSRTYKHSRIRIQLSRPLTYAEREKLTTDHHTVGARLNVARNINGFLFKLRVSPNGTHVWVDADTPSRLLYEVVAAALDAHFVNVYPTAVRTFTEYHV